MKRDTLKTLAGLIVIGGIVVATFLYGNSQRQQQQARDQEAKKQQAAQSPTPAVAANTVSPSVTPSPTAKPSPTATASPKATPSPSPKAAANTAPVKSPASNSLQGSGGSGTALGDSATPSPSPVTTTPAAGGTGTSLPEAGPEMMGLVGVGSIAFMLMKVRGSRRAIEKAARSRGTDR